MSRGKRWKAISGKRKSRNEYGVNGGNKENVFLRMRIVINLELLFPN